MSIHVTVSVKVSGAKPFPYNVTRTLRYLERLDSSKALERADCNSLQNSANG